MMKLMQKIMLKFLICLILSSCSSITVGTYNIQDDFKTINKMKTFDIKTYNEKSINGTYEFETDSSRVKQIKYFDNYVEYIHPKGKFYDVYNVYYPNGKIKEHGIRLDGMKIGKWEFYDEQGNVTIVDEDADFDEFDYNKVLLFLDEKGYIDIHNGDGADNFSLNYNLEAKQWKVTAKDKNEKWLVYILSGKTGRVVKVMDLKMIE